MSGALHYIDTHRAAARIGSIKAEDRDQRLIDSPHLIGCELSDPTSKSLDINGTDLFDENPRGSSCNRNLRSERSWASTS